MSDDRHNHDTAHREIFAHPKAVEDLLRHFIKQPWVAELDFSTLARETEISVSRNKGLKQRDIVWSVKLESQDLFIVVLLEFQSRSDRVMALRLADYAITLYEDLLKQKRRTVGGKLPPILPIVLYNGPRRWKSPQSIEEMVSEVPEGLAPYQLRMSYIVLDELRTPVTLPEQEGSIIASLFALQQGQDQEEVLQAVYMLVQLLQAPEQESLRQACKGFVLKVLPTEYAPIAEVFDQPENAMTLAQRLIRNEERQRAAAHTAGIKEGQLEGQRRTLSQLLQFKFGSIDPLTQARLNEAAAPQLDQLALRIMTAKSLDELWS